MYDVFCTYKVEDPAHSAVPSAGQHSEISNVSEEVQPASKHSGPCASLQHHVGCFRMNKSCSKTVCADSQRSFLFLSLY